MSYLLDTNVVSELRKARTLKIDPHVARWVDTVDAEDLFISVITLMEIEKGILNLSRRDAAQAKILRKWFENRVLVEFANRILPIDKNVALYCARLHVPDKRSANDSLIASIAHCHEMTVVTRNTKDFTEMGVRLLNPWEQG